MGQFWYSLGLCTYRVRSGSDLFLSQVWDSFGTVLGQFWYSFGSCIYQVMSGLDRFLGQVWASFDPVWVEFGFKIVSEGSPTVNTAQMYRVCPWCIQRVFLPTLESKET